MLVYKFGVRPPTEGANLVAQQLRTGHNYYNLLTQCSRGHRAALRADIAVVVTGSDEDGLRAMAERFVCSPLNVIMPWQDWRDGRAIVDYRGAAIPKLGRPTNNWLPPVPPEEPEAPPPPDWAPWMG